MLTSITKYIVHQRDVLALLIAFPLSAVFTAFVFAASFMAGIAFIISCFLLSLSVCLVSDQRTTFIALISNLIFIFMTLTYKYMILGHLFAGWTSETPSMLLITFGIALFFALLFSIPFTLIRKKIW